MPDSVDRLRVDVASLVEEVARLNREKLEREEFIRELSERLSDKAAVAGWLMENWPGPKRWVSTASNTPKWETEHGELASFQQEFANYPKPVPDPKFPWFWFFFAMIALSAALYANHRWNKPSAKPSPIVGCYTDWSLL